MNTKASQALAAGMTIPKRHFCPTHGEECKAVQFRPARGQARIRFNCPGKDGDAAHQLPKGATVLK